MATRVGGAGGYQHYQKCQKMGISEMPVAIVLGCPPYVAFMGPQNCLLVLMNSPLPVALLARR